MKKALIIISGGIDSITLLHEIIKSHDKVIALSFNYGSKHNDYELKRAEETCRKLGVEHKIFDIKSIFDNFNSALLDHKDSEQIPEGHYASKNMKQTVVPFRNGILLSIAVGFAESLGINQVYYGAHAGDHTIYPDCRPKFVKYISKAALQGTYNQVKIAAPYSRLTKIDIVKRGEKLGVDYSLTWTCYNPTKDNQPCMKCGSCCERTEAFFKNQLKDPLYNDVGWQKAVDYYLKVIQ